MSDNLFYSFNNYCYDIFKTKIYKVSIDGGFTCPNRDGTKGIGGCIFCNERGSSTFSKSNLSIKDQIDAQISILSKKYKGNQFLAYFQNYTNTYASVGHLERLYLEALSHPKIKGLVIATRPDCLGKDILRLLDRINRSTFLWVELGLQTINENVAKSINRCYQLRSYLDATDKLNELFIKFVTHIIIGLPFENYIDPLNTAIYATQHNSWGIKLHSMYINKNTKLFDLYKKGLVLQLTKEDYIKRVCEILCHIPSKTVIHRLTGDGDPKEIVAPLWTLNKKDVLNSIHKYMSDNKLYQGKYFNQNEI